MKIGLEIEMVKHGFDSGKKVLAVLSTEFGEAVCYTLKKPQNKHYEILL